MSPDAEKRPRPGGDDRALDDERVDKGLRAVFTGAGESDEQKYRSVLDDLSQKMGPVSRFQLTDPDEEPSPLHRPRSGSEDLPAQIGRYRIAGEIARGGVGVVYKANDEDLGRDVALKLLLGDYRNQPEITQRFLEEAQIGAQLQHPSLVPVHELGLLGGERPYFAMKLVKGKTLARLLSERPEPGDDRLRFLGIFEQVCQPLAYAHARGVIHRDLKPSNVMVGTFGEVQVMDWGLAKVLARGGIADDRLSRTNSKDVSTVETVRSGSSSLESLAGSVLGTPAYMAPEQARGDVEDLDERADVFGLGAVLCEILTGSPPYMAGSAKEVQRLAKKGYLDEAYQRLERCGADREVVELAQRCLAFEPRDRPKDARAVAQAIRSYLESLEERARRTELRAAKTKARAASLVLCALAVGMMGMSYLWVDKERQEVAAEARLRLERAVSEAKVAKTAAESADSGPAEWSAALEAVENAEDLVTPQSAPEVKEELARLRHSIASEVRVHELLASLEEIPELIAPNVTHFTKDTSYAEAFATFFGADIFAIPPSVAAERIRQTSASVEILHALEDWALTRREIRQPWETLRDIALAVDPSPSRSRVWQLLEDPDPAAVDRFLETLDEDDKLSATLLSRLAKQLSDNRNDETAERVLRRALDFEPASVRANFSLGALLTKPRVGRRTEGLAFLTAARQLHYQSVSLRLVLLHELRKAGLHEQTLEECTKLLEQFRLLPHHYNHIYRVTLQLLDSENLSFSRRSLDRFLKAVEYTLDSHGSWARELWEPLGVARALRYVDENPGDVLAAARSDVQRTERRDPYVLNMQARVQFAAGRLEEAIRTLEEAIALPDGLPTWSGLLREWRRAVLPALVSYGSIDAALRPKTTIVPEGAEWRYFPGTELPSDGAAWTRKTFDNRQWKRGPSAFGYGDGDYRTPLPRMRGNYSSLYLRRSVEIEDPSRFRRLYLHVIADDGFVAYVNGKLAGSARMDHRDHGLDAVAREANRPIAPVEIDVTRHLVPGQNLLAIRGANNARTDGSFSIALRLLGELRFDAEGERHRLERFRTVLEERDAPALLAYLEGRLLQRMGQLSAAAEKFREAARNETQSAAPFERLWETLEATHGQDTARRLIREAARQHLPADHIKTPLNPPRGLTSRKVERGVELAIAERFWHPDPRVNWEWTRWQIRTEHGEYDPAPVLDVRLTQGETTLTVPRHQLRPDTRYVWKVSWSSTVVGSATSDEHSFDTDHYPFETIPVDLLPDSVPSDVQKDLVADPGDQENDTIDNWGGLFVVDGFDGRLTGRAMVQGLPADRLVGAHVLEDYAGPNAIQLGSDETRSISVDVPVRRYSALRFALVSAFGNAQLPVSLVYDDGATEQRMLHARDWFDDAEHDGVGYLLTSETTPILNGMDRMYNGRFENSNDPALLETSLEVDPRRELVAFRLESRHADFSDEGTRLSIFAVTGVWAGEAD